MLPLLQLGDEADFRAHFVNTYCLGTLTTFDQIEVRFQRSDFDHCCFESNRRTRIKERFSTVRAERLDWIKAALQDPGADLRVGWDNQRKCHDTDRRVAIISGNYVVIIRFTKPGRARFVTAYLADSGNTIQLIKKSPKWRRTQT